MRRWSPPAAGMILLSLAGWDGLGPCPAQESVSLSPAAIVHAATYRPNTIAPGQMVTIFLAGLGPGSAISPALGADGRLPQVVEGVRAFFDGEPAPLFYVGPDQM